MSRQAVCPLMCVASRLQTRSQQRSDRNVLDVREDREQRTTLAGVGVVAQEGDKRVG